MIDPITGYSTLQIPIYQIDAFTETLFGGNPAAVCPLERWLDDDVLQSIASENNLSETAFFVAEGAGFRLRWFTPVVEVDFLRARYFGGGLRNSQPSDASEPGSGIRDPFGHLECSA